MNAVALSDPYIRVKTGEANTYNITTDHPPVINEIRSACCKRCSTNLCCLFAIASLIEGTSAVERAYVIKAGSDRSGNA
ncbi:Uncharacterised protein [Streptococcus pneumoniae]|nr:Uncharacterised protein [Streptococcus pneumoniae]COF86097.1 Uncharacterised protein [Streptococcus pneumoniae]CRH97658.1 Uncharacterised protein [Streptococcus pneumoniae]